MGLSEFNYLPPRTRTLQHLAVERTLAQMNDVKLKQWIHTTKSAGPVLVYAERLLLDRLSIKTIISQTTPAKECRDLKEGQILGVEDPVVMRGTDFRSNATMTILLCRGFGTERSLQQALARVGRFGDSCQRVRMHGVNLIDDDIRMPELQRLIDFLSTREVAKRPEPANKPQKVKPEDAKMANKEHKKKKSKACNPPKQERAGQRKQD